MSKEYFLKVCCISSPEEAQMALENGADFIGLVGPMPSGPGILSLEEISQIVRAIPAEATTVLLTSSSDVSAIIADYNQVQTKAIQLVRELSVSELTAVRNALPDVMLLAVVHVEDASAIERAKSYEDSADYILLDSGKPTAGILGGTGNTHDWSVSKRIVEEVKIPVLLAGGLNAENVKDALEGVNPHGVDLCSGVRTNGHLDPEKLRDFVSQL